jgi:hypothetical protein
MAERTVGRWKIVSSVSISVAGAMTCLVGSFSYFTFWDETSSDLFTIYPPSKVVDSAELLLSVTMLFTYPMPFFTTRELLVEWLVMRWSKSTSSDNEDELGGGEMELEGGKDVGVRQKLLPGDSGPQTSLDAALETYMVPSSLGLGSTYQLKRPYHAALTLVIWGVTLFIALAADSLGTVLDLVGCVSGSAIAFIIPAAVNIKLENKCGVAISTMLCVGCFITVMGSVFSIIKLVQ